MAGIREQIGGKQQRKEVCHLRTEFRRMRRRITFVGRHASEE